MTPAGRPQAPNFLYLGPDKAGSTWLAAVLRWHPEIFVTPAKDTYYFDRYYERGMTWYLAQFSGWQGEAIVAELCHDYLYSPVAITRIAKDLQAPRAMVTLREPVSRALSAYRYLLKHGRYRGTFEEAIRERPELLEHGRYSPYLTRAFERLGRDSVLVADFDLLGEDPRAFASKVFRFLEVADLELPSDMLAPILEAQASRSLALARAVKVGAQVARRFGAASTVGRVKSLRWIERALYRPFAPGERFEPSVETMTELRRSLEPHVKELSRLLGTDYLKAWGYEQ